jgi:hypothetical protein
LGGGENEDVPVIAFEFGEHQLPMKPWIFDREPRLFLNLAFDTLLRRFPRFELASSAVPFALVNIINFFVAMFQI